MYATELELRVRYEELRRQSDRRRLVREAAEATRDAAHFASDDPEGQVRTARARRGRVRRAAA
ncbi:MULTISPECIES: hypothetical protein [unclassified Streptomyces]|uniref:hypothetical protein n=1 Tax=unclassified Streptomyces TaxID=2593676 RepID=UPI000C275366|nr:hypothetical protein [Streptomyces sp. CB02959]PJN42344.1 hypothetical protein CG747_01010 [Streptomyces sp. CB02959]